MIVPFSSVLLVDFTAKNNEDENPFNLQILPERVIVIVIKPLFYLSQYKHVFHPPGFTM